MEQPALDDDTANRLLRGSLPPEDAPAGFEAVAALLRAATGPATDDEVADPHGVVQALAAELRDRPAPVDRPDRAARRPRRLRRLVASPALVAALVATGAAAAAAATGDLPRPVQSAVAGVASHAGIDLPEPAAHHGHGRHAGAAPASADAASGGDASGATTATSGSGTLAPPLNGPALRALCGAYASGNGVARGGKADATPFRALADAATASGQTVDEYCATATGATGGVTPPTTEATTPPTTAPASRSSAPPSSNGTGNAPGVQHGPPATLGNGAPHPSTSTTVAHGNPHGAPPGQQNANTGNGNAGGNATSNARGGNRAGHP